MRAARRRGRRSTGSSRGASCRGRRPDGRHRPRGRARRRRHDPDRAARFAGHGRAGVRGQLRRDRLPRHGRAVGARGGRRAGARGRVRRDGAARRSWPTTAGGRAARRQRHLLPPAPGRRAWPSSRTRSQGEELGEVRCDGLVVVDAGRLDGLQPRQRRAGAGLGRGGLRGLVHRAAHAHGAVARGGAGRHARGAPTARPRGRWT